MRKCNIFHVHNPIKSTLQNNCISHIGLIKHITSQKHNKVNILINLNNLIIAKENLNLIYEIKVGS